MTEHEKINPSVPLRWSDLLGAIPPTPGPAPDPTTDEVRDRYMSDIQANEWGLGSYSLGDYGAAFERWLVAHDAEVAARALREAADEMHLYGDRYPVEHRHGYVSAEIDAGQYLNNRADELGQP